MVMVIMISGRNYLSFLVFILIIIIIIMTVTYQVSSPSVIHFHGITERVCNRPVSEEKGLLEIFAKTFRFLTECLQPFCIFIYVPTNMMLSMSD